MSIKKGSSTIASSVPTTEWGSIEGAIADQADLMNNLNSKASTYSPVFTGTPTAPTAATGTATSQIATTSFVSESIKTIEALPSQSGNAGKFLTTNGTSASWSSVEALPTQTGNSGKFLTTNGTTASWSDTVVTTNTEQSITGHKTFTGRVDFSGTGDDNAVYLTTNTRFDVKDTTNTILGFSSSTFLINHSNYSLTLRGKDTRPKYNSSDMALYSDVSDKAPLASPALTGTPTAPTAASGTNTTQIATTAFAQDVVKSKMTNCITEIPQDINLTLSDGTLTLKAGSKVYIPNGFESDGTTPKFDTEILTSDVVFDGVDSIRSGAFLTYNTNGRSTSLKHWSQWNPDDVYSGTTEPTASGNKIWYDTSSNIIKEMNDGSTWTILHTSFPFCTFSSTATSVTSIDQVFNGFGYIGSTVFVLPNIKCLVPNGRNSDGSLKSIEYTVPSVIRSDDGIPFSANQTSYITVDSKNNTIGRHNILATKYDEASNYLVKSDGTDLSTCVVLGSTTGDGTYITLFDPKTCFHALDYNDKGTIAGWGMPSSKYIDLTLGSSGSSYTAPANGWVNLQKTADANQYIWITNSGQTIGFYAPNYNGGSCLALFPVKKGDNFTISYDASGSTVVFRFTYAEGEK